MAKVAILVLFAACVALGSATTFGGVKDIVGNYYDYTTGQYASALTGRVYNTGVAPVAPVAYAAPYAPAVASPYYYNAPYSYGAAYVSPVWKK